MVLVVLQRKIDLFSPILTLVLVKWYRGFMDLRREGCGRGRHGHHNVDGEIQTSASWYRDLMTLEVQEWLNKIDIDAHVIQEQDDEDRLEEAKDYWCLGFSIVQMWHLRHLRQLNMYWHTKFFIILAFQVSICINREMVHQLDMVKFMLKVVNEWCSSLV